MFDTSSCHIEILIFLCAEIMTNITKPKFHVLDLSGQIYQSWRLDVKLHLQEKGIVKSLKENGNANDKDKVNALIFMHFHLHKSLKVQSLMVRDHLEL